MGPPDPPGSAASVIPWLNSPQVPPRNQGQASSAGTGPVRLVGRGTPRGGAGTGRLTEAGLVNGIAFLDEIMRRRLGDWQLFGRPPGDDEGAALRSARDLMAGASRDMYGGVNLMLPGDFYQQVRGWDRSGSLTLHPTDGQLLAVLHLWDGRVVELPSGEGKTVAVALAAALHALAGRAVHIATANDYLAHRDCRQMANFLHWRGPARRVGAGAVGPGMTGGRLPASGGVRHRP